MRSKVDEEFPHRIIAKELDDLNDIIESSYGLIAEQFLKIPVPKPSDRKQVLTPEASNAGSENPFEEEPVIKLPRVVRGQRAISQVSTSMQYSTLQSTRAQIDVHDAVKHRILWNVWNFDQLHDKHMAPEFTHRVKSEVKHMNFVGEGLVIVNNADENIDVYLEDSPQKYTELDIQGRQMNTSMQLQDRLVIGCRDHRLFVFDVASLLLLKTVDMPASVHCMSTLKAEGYLAVGMSDGHLMLFDTNDDLKLVCKSHFKEIGGIWCMSSCNFDSDLALGTIGGLFCV